MPPPSSHHDQEHIQAGLPLGHGHVPVLPPPASATEPDWSLAPWQQRQPESAEEQLLGLAAAHAGQEPSLGATQGAAGYGQTMWGLYQALGQSRQQQQQQQPEQPPLDQGPHSIGSKDHQQRQDQIQQQPQVWQQRQQMQQQILLAREDPSITSHISRQPLEQQQHAPPLGSQQQGLGTELLGQQEADTTPPLGPGSGSSGGRLAAAVRSRPDSSKRKLTKPRIVPPAPPAAPTTTMQGIEGAWLTVNCGALTGVLDLSDMLVRVQLETVSLLHCAVSEYCIYLQIVKCELLLCLYTHAFALC